METIYFILFICIALVGITAYFATKADSVKTQLEAETERANRINGLLLESQADLQEAKAARRNAEITAENERGLAERRKDEALELRCDLEATGTRKVKNPKPHHRADKHYTEIKDNGKVLGWFTVESMREARQRYERLNK